MFSFIKIFLSSLLVMCFLTSCSNNFKRTIGFGKNLPNEYLISENPSLSIPKNFRIIKPSEQLATQQGNAAYETKDFEGNNPSDTGEEVISEKSSQIPSKKSGQKSSKISRGEQAILEKLLQ